MKRYWDVLVWAQSGRPGDINPVATFKVVTLNGEGPSDGDMIEACVWAGVKRGRVPVFRHNEITSFDPPGDVSFKCGTSETWVIEAPFDRQPE